MMDLELDIFALTEAQDDMLDLNIELDFSDNKTTLHTFYNISYITPYNKYFCIIVSDGIQSICCDSYSTVKNRISNARYQCLN